MKLPLLGLAIPLLCVAATGQSAADFLPPARGGATEIAEPDAVEVVTDEAVGELVRAATVQDAAIKASQVLQLDEGCQPFEATDGSGLGWMASAKASYATDSPNPDAVRLDRRYAYCEAYLRARAQLAITLQGLGVEQRAKLATKDAANVTEDESRTEGERTTEETVRDYTAATIRGASLFRVEDDGSGTVTVQVYVTPATRRGAQVLTQDGVTAADLTKGLDEVLTEIKLGVIPPVGGRVVQVKATNQTAFVGFGSALIPSVADPRARLAGKRAATQAAQMRARAALVATMRGEQISVDETLGGASGSRFTNLERFRQQADPDPEGAAKEVDGYRRTSTSSESVSRTIEAVMQGQLPPGVQTNTYEYPETGWIVAIAVFLPAAPDKPAEPAPAAPVVDPTKAGPTGGVGTDPRKKEGGGGPR